MPRTTPDRRTIAHALADFLARDEDMNAKERVPTADDYNAAWADFSSFEAVAGLPFQMAADLLGVSPALLSGILEAGADSEREIAFATPEGLERAALYEGSDALRAAAAMYEAENPKPEPVPGPDMRNDALADLLDDFDSLSFSMQAAVMSEAAQRIRERGDEEEG